MQSQLNPPIVHIVGRKGSGKTALIVDLIRTLSARGYRVAGVRHSPHTHSVDAAGTDTETFKKAGAVGSALITANETDIFFPAIGWEEKCAPVRCAFYNCHLILVEGGLQNSREKIEVIPAGEKPLCAGDVNLRAVVSPDYRAYGLPSFRPDEADRLCVFIEEHYIKAAISGAIMAGGRSRRLGVNKAFLQIQGRPVIERVLETISSLVSPVRIITNSPGEYQYLGAEVAADIRPGCGPLSGIHTALSLSPTEYVLVVSCDLPLLTADSLRPLLSEYPGFDITMYKHTLFEPLCAIYRRTCLPALEELIDHGEYRIIDLFPALTAKIIRVENTEAFQSINTQEDYEQVLKKAEKSL